MRHKRGRVGIPETHQPYVKKGIFLKIGRPVLPEDTRTEAETCTRRRAVLEENEARINTPHPFEAFLMKHAYKMFEENKLVAVFHKIPMPQRDFDVIRLRLLKAGFRIPRFNNKVIRLALTDTKYENILPLFQSYTMIVSCEKPDVATLIKKTKRFSQISLLGAVVEGEIMSQAGLQYYASLPPLDIMRSVLCQTLSSAPAQTAQLLSSHQSSFRRNLEQYIRQQSEVQEDDNS